MVSTEMGCWRRGGEAQEMGKNRLLLTRRSQWLWWLEEGGAGEMPVASG